jgi:TPR repeat protein
VDRGFVPALVEMGIWYYSGKWVAQDAMEADSLWHRAERAGSRDAAVRLAVTALREAGSDAPDSVAIALLRKAIPEGSLLAQVGLGYCHEHGIGVRKDAGEAAVLYRAAAVRGSQDAFRALRRLYDAMRPSEKEFAIEEE